MTEQELEKLCEALGRSPSLSAQYVGVPFVKIEPANEEDARTIYEILEKIVANG